MLEDAAVSRAEVFIACTRSDERNIVANIAAKRLGAKRTPCVLMGSGTVPGALEVADLAKGRVSLIRYGVAHGATATEKPLRSLQLPANTRLVHVRRGSDLIVPRATPSPVPATR